LTNKKTSHETIVYVGSIIRLHYHCYIRATQHSIESFVWPIVYSLGLFIHKNRVCNDLCTWLDPQNKDRPLRSGMVAGVPQRLARRKAQQPIRRAVLVAARHSRTSRQRTTSSLEHNKMVREKMPDRAVLCDTCTPTPLFWSISCSPAVSAASWPPFSSSSTRDCSRLCARRTTF
jgi:hypothetical protein